MLKNWIIAISLSNIDMSVSKQTHKILDKSEGKRRKERPNEEASKIERKVGGRKMG